MKVTPFIIFTFLCFNYLTAQNEANIWYFGFNAGLDFNSGDPEVLLDGQLDTREGCATISDKNGNLLFYTGGVVVYNKEHSIMVNGEGLRGHPSSTHSAIIVPKPGSTDIYYIFTVDVQLGDHGLQYSVVDMSLDGGLGEVTEKNILLFDSVPEKVTAYKRTDTDAYWVVSQKYNSNEFIAYEVTESGVNTTPVVSAVGIPNDEVARQSSQLKISPDGTKMAYANGWELQVFDFNQFTGEVSNPLALLQYANTYGVEFSPDSSLVYVSYLSGVSQFNLNAGTGSETDVDNSRIELVYSSGESFGSIQLGPDKKIYITKVNGEYLDVITDPDTVGTDCNYLYNDLYLGGRSSHLGLPTFISNIITLEKIAFENVCFGDATQFYTSSSVDSVVWDFGDPASGANNSSTEFEPTHIFTNPGTYEVSVTATATGQTQTETTTVTIYEQPTATQPSDVLTCDDNNDGIYNFDLTEQDSAILNGQDPSIFEVLYYASIEDYNNNLPIEDPTSFNNQSAFVSQTIVASVRRLNNIACEASTTFNIQVYETPTPNQSVTNLVLCDNLSVGTNTDGLVQVDLTVKETEILNGQSSDDFEVRYFLDESFTNEILAQGVYQTASAMDTIYVQVLNKINSGCSANTKFVIEVLELPNISPSVDLVQCDDDLDGFSIFNLIEVEAELSANYLKTIIFYESQADAENAINPINDTTAYTNQTTSNDTIWARVGNDNDCYSIAQVNLIVTTTQIPDTFVRDFYACDPDNDGISEFDFSSIDSEIEALFPSGQQLIISYYTNENDALLEENAIADIANFSNTDSPDSQQIYTRVDNELNNDCLGLGAYINLYTEPLPVANTVTIESQCDDDQDGLFPFDTSEIEAQVLGSQSLTDVSIRYFDENGSELSSPLPNPFLSTSQTLTIRVTNNRVTDTNCYAETTLNLVVNQLPIAYSIDIGPVCDGSAGDTDNDGLFPFDTSNIDASILNGQQGFEIHYYDENMDELPSPLPNPFTSASQTITAKVINPENNSCEAETSFDLVVNSLPDFEVETPLMVCSSNPTFTVTLDPIEFNASKVFNYEWTFEDGAFLSNESTYTTSTPGTYYITLTKTDGSQCSRTKEIFVIASEAPNISSEDIAITDNSDNNTITINTTNLGLGDYEFSLNNDLFDYQDDPVFTNVPAGIHTIYVRDKKGCGTSEVEVSVIGYNRFFTPNGDGTNDFWKVEGLSATFQPNSKLYIFDRYGKLLKDLSTSDPLGWDGTYNGKQLPSSDYWFKLLLEDGRHINGHFSLKR